MDDVVTPGTTKHPQQTNALQHTQRQPIQKGFEALLARGPFFGPLALGSGHGGANYTLRRVCKARSPTPPGNDTYERTNAIDLHPVNSKAVTDIHTAVSSLS